MNAMLHEAESDSPSSNGLVDEIAPAMVPVGLVDGEFVIASESDIENHSDGAEVIIGNDEVASSTKQHILGANGIVDPTEGNADVIAEHFIPSESLIDERNRIATEFDLEPPPNIGRGRYWIWIDQYNWYNIDEEVIRANNRVARNLIKSKVRRRG